MSVVRVGSTSRYAEGWAAIFGGKPAKQARGRKKLGTRAAKKTVRKAAKKAGGRKSGKKRR